MSDLEDVLRTSKRNFIVIAHRARSDGNIHLNDLCGASGRWDGVARSITSALFLSHDMRRDTSIHILLLGPDDPPKLLTVNGGSVKYLNPDERASSALMKKCLKEYLPQRSGYSITPSPGITITRTSLNDVLETLNGKVFNLHEDGIPMNDPSMVNVREGPITFVLSDDMDLTEEEDKLIREGCLRTISIGPTILHTHMTISIIHHFLDMAG